MHLRRDAKKVIEAIARKRVEAMKAIRETSYARFIKEHCDGEVWAVPQNLRVGKEFFTSEMYLRQQERADWQHVDNRLMLFAAKFIERARKQNIPLYVHSAFRSQSDQAQLYGKGVSKARWPRAPHCQGAAVDVVHSLHHWDMTKKEWQFLNLMAMDEARKLDVAITWGGDWSFYDPAHYELTEWRKNIRHLHGEKAIRKTPRSILKER